MSIPAVNKEYISSARPRSRRPRIAYVNLANNLKPSSHSKERTERQDSEDNPFRPKLRRNKRDRRAALEILKEKDRNMAFNNK